MNLEKYEIETEIDSTYFEFVSKGSQGNIVKVVKYIKLFEGQDLYNLGFGDKNIETGELDDRVITNNGDADKVLATVALTLVDFFQEHPNAIVYSKGSSPSRTRLYQINVSKYLEEIEKEFDVYGELESTVERFKKGINYTGFYVVKHKI
jgi:hypothetical protein